MYVNAELDCPGDQPIESSHTVPLVLLSFASVKLTLSTILQESAVPKAQVQAPVSAAITVVTIFVDEALVTPGGLVLTATYDMSCTDVRKLYVTAAPSTLCI